MAETTVIREATIRYRLPRRAPSRMDGPEAVARFFRGIVGGDAREHLIALYLDVRNHPIGYQVVSVGTANSTLVHPREVFQPAVHLGAVTLAIGHNHPSGDPSPSTEDLALTGRIAEAGKLLGIALLDHVVFSDRGYVSIRELRPELLS